MSDIKITGDASGDAAIDRLTSSVERLEISLSKLAAGNSALDKMQKQMAAMTKVMKSGFDQLIELQSSMEARSERQAEMAGARRAAQEEATAERKVARAAAASEKLLRQQIEHEQRQEGLSNKSGAKQLEQQIAYEQRQEALANKHNYKQIELQDTLHVKQLADYVKFWEKIIASQVAAENTQKAIQEKRQVEAHTAQTKAAADYVGLWEKMLAERQAIQERRDVEMHNLRQREFVDYVSWWDKMLAEQASKQAKQVEMAHAQQAALVAIRRRQMAELVTPAGSVTTGGASPAVGSSAAAIHSHNDAMREGHALARGLAGSLGGLWLTYGSLVPLVAGAALAGSLKHIVTVGKEVENQLNFVFALSENREGVNLDQFLKITDSSLHSVVEAANAMRALAQNGLTASQSLQVLPAIMDLATVGEMTVAQAAIAATGAVSAFGLSFSEAGRAGDIFAKTAATSNTSVLAITESMKQASTVASLFKVTIEETAGVLGVLAKINITGGAAGTSMTNMLTGLYEPTEKGKRALKELGLETMTTSGALKPFTQLMEEMRGALAGFNDSAKVDLLGSIFTIRGVKSVQQVQENLEEYKKKVAEATTATGFMRTVVMQLEDSTDGAFKRLGVSVERTFAQGFKEASPYVQQLGLHLADAFKDGSTMQTGLANLAVNVARMAGAVVDGIPAIAAMGALFLGYKILGPVAALFQTAAAASAVFTAAQGASALATEANTIALGRGTATRALHTSMIQGQTAATLAGTAATAAWTAVLLPALGALAIAIGAAAALWLIFRDNTEAADTVNVKLGNSLHVVTEQLDKEIERLEKSEKLWNARQGRFDKEAPVTPMQLVESGNQVRDLEKQIRASGGDPAAIRASKNVETMVDPGTGMTSVSYVHKLGEALLAADKNQAGFLEQTRRFNEISTPKTAQENIRKSTDTLGVDIEKFARKGSEVDSKGVLYQQNEAVRDLYRQAGALKQELIDPIKIFKDPKLEVERIDGIRTSLKMLGDEVNSMQSGRAAKPDKTAAADARVAARDDLAEKLKALDYQLALEKLESNAAISGARQQNKRGELGDLQLINVELAEKLSIDQKAVEVARQQWMLTTDVKGKAGKAQEYDNRKNLATAQAVIDTQAASEARLSVLDRMSQEEAKLDAKTLSDKGEHVKAFLADYEASYGTTVARVTADLIANEGTIYEEGLSRYLTYLEKMKQAGANDARGKELKDSFAAAFSALELQLQTLGNASGPGTGLATIFDNALRAEQALVAAMPDLIKKQAEMQALADGPGGTDVQKKDAIDELKRIEGAAARMRNIFVDAGRDIEKALTAAFGNPGKALGGLISRSIEYASKQKQIDADLAKNSKGADPTKLADLQKKASKDSAMAQISAYGDMAGAAKGFFDEQSGGYKILATAEKAFRIAELAMTFEGMAAKLFATTTVTTAKVTAQTIEAGAAVANVPIVVAAEGAKSSAYGITALAAALALPFPANLPAFAVVAGMLAMIGVAVAGSGGSGSVPLSEQRQEKNGTGSVLGDSKAKSESISKSLALIDKNTFQDLAVSGSMLTVLQNIEAGIGGLGALVARNMGQGTTFGDMKGSNKPLTGSAASMLGVGASAGAVLGSYFGPIGTVIGAIGGAILGALSRVKVNVQDQGLAISSKSLGDTVRNGVSGNSYADINTKKSFLGVTFSNNNSRDTQSLSAETLSQFTMVITNLRGGVLAAADAIGAGGDSFIAKLDAIAVSIPDISTKGLTGEEIQKALEAAFSKLGDDLAKTALGGMEQFQKVGEGYLETVMRVAAGYQTIDVVFQSFGKLFGVIGVESVAARQRLIDLSGGLEEFTSQGTFFLKNFFTEGEQAAALKARIDPTLKQYGLSTEGDNAAKQLRDFVVALDTTTVAGAQTYAALMAIAPAFLAVIDGVREAADKAAEESSALLELQAEIYELTGDKAGAAAVLQQQHTAALVGLSPAVAAATEKLWRLQAAATALEAVRDNATTLLSAVDDAFAMVQKVVDREKAAKTKAHDAEMKALDKRIDAETKAVAKHKSLADALHASLDAMKPIELKDERASAQAQIKAALAIARTGGPLPEADSLKKALSTIGQDPSGMFATYQDFQRDFYSTQNDIAALSKLTDSTLSIEERSLEALISQKETAQLAFEKEIERLDAVVETARAQVDVLKGSDITLLSIDQTLKNLLAAMFMAQQNPIVGATATINSTYQSALGRAPEAAGLKFWQDQAAGGMTPAAIAAMIKDSPEAKARDLYKTVLGREGESSGMDFWMKALSNGMSVDAARTAMMQSAEYKLTHGIPGFANGGDHFGGLRVVGEVGPEIEATGASRIHSTRDLMASLSNPSANNDALLAELKEQRRENLEMKRMLEAHLYIIAKHSQTVADIQEKQEAIGVPPEREV